MVGQLFRSERLLGLSAIALTGLFAAMLFPTLPDSATAQEATITTSVKVLPVIGLAAAESYTVNVTPTEHGAFNKSTQTLTVTTNNETGYSIYLQTENGQPTLASTTSSSTINAVTDGSLLADFDPNTWGYNLDQSAVSDATTTYHPVPTTTGGNPAGSSDAPAPDGDSYNLTFGTLVDTSLPSGAYSNRVVLSVLANPAYVPTISAMTNMQDITAEICAASADGETATLTDTRDSNTYTVAKINDACWMTQNLRLSGDRTLTPADSDVTSSWEFPNNSLKSDDTNYIGNSYTEAGSVISDDPEHATEYGGYYNYCAASAGSVCEQTEMDATQSICPAGWELPTKAQFDTIAGNSSYTSAFSPVLSGLYDDGSLDDTGSRGLWWSATAYDSNFQYFLFYRSGSLSTIYDYKVSKRLGLSVRCVRSS